MLQTNSTSKSDYIYLQKQLLGVKCLHYLQGNNLKSEYMTSLNGFVCNISSSLPVFQSTDPLEGTDLPGIVFRLSSLTITKALIRLESSSSEDSDGLLVLLSCVLLSVVRVCGLFFRASVGFQEASYFYTWIHTKRWNQVHKTLRKL